MSSVNFDPEAIRALAQILRETDLSEIELVEGENRIRVVRQATVAQVAVAAPMAAPAALPAAAPRAAAPVEDPADHPGAIPSPMVGVAYL